MGDLEDTRLRNSIVGLMLICYVVESAIFFMITRVYSLSRVFFCFFLGAQTIFLGGVSVYLIVKRKFFYLVKTGKALSSVNLASRITLFRLTMTPTVLFLIIALKSSHVGPVLVLFIGISCLSDLFDGYISRRCDEETFMGKILDSACDYLFLGIVAIAYYIYSFLPSWLFWLIISRLLLHSAGMLILFLLRRKLIPQTTIMGKVAVAATMVLFVFKPVARVFPAMVSWTRFIETGAGILIGLSLVDKILYLARGIARSSAKRQA